MKISTLQTVLIVTCLSVLTGCASTYYGTLEKVGIHKRDMMVDRVEDARDAQEEAKEHFQTALEQFTSVVEFKGGDLEKKYNQLNDTYEECEKKADNVHKRIGKVEGVSEALFEEWEEELDLYSSPRLREDSKKKLDQTRRDYNRLIKAMKKAGLDVSFCEIEARWGHDAFLLPSERLTALMKGFLGHGNHSS